MPCYTLVSFNVYHDGFCVLLSSTDLQVMPCSVPPPLLFWPRTSLAILDSSPSWKGFRKVFSPKVTSGAETPQTDAMYENTTTLTHRAILISANQCCLC